MVKTSTGTDHMVWPTITINSSPSIRGLRRLTTRATKPTQRVHAVLAILILKSNLRRSGILLPAANRNWCNPSQRPITEI